MKKKRDEAIKDIICANVSMQRAHISCKEATSMTAASEAIINTGVIYEKQKIVVLILNTPNAFVQTDIELGGDKIIMKIREQLVNTLLEIFPGVYDKYVQYKKRQNIFYIRILKALYVMFVYSIFYYKKFRNYIKVIGFEVNPYNICVANHTKCGKKQTVNWNVDDLESSHVDPKLNDEFQ